MSTDPEVKYTEDGKVKLYVGSLPFDTRPPELIDMFCKYGNCSNANVIMEKEDPSRSRGFGFIEFDTLEEATQAIEGLNETPLGHRHIMVQHAGKPASGKPPQRRGRGGGRGGSRGGFGGRGGGGRGGRGGQRGGRGGGGRGGYGGQGGGYGNYSGGRGRGGRGGNSGGGYGGGYNQGYNNYSQGGGYGDNSGYGGYNNGYSNQSYGGGYGGGYSSNTGGDYSGYAGQSNANQGRSDWY